MHQKHKLMNDRQWKWSAHVKRWQVVAKSDRHRHTPSATSLIQAILHCSIFHTPAVTCTPCRGGTWITLLSYKSETNSCNIITKQRRGELCHSWFLCEGKRKGKKDTVWKLKQYHLKGLKGTINKSHKTSYLFVMSVKKASNVLCDLFSTSEDIFSPSDALVFKMYNIFAGSILFFLTWKAFDDVTNRKNIAGGPAFLGRAGATLAIKCTAC